MKEKGFYLIKEVFFTKKRNIYNKVITLYKPILSMENILKNFDDISRSVIKELVKDNKKFTDLISRLQIARNKVDNGIEITRTLTQKINK